MTSAGEAAWLWGRYPAVLVSLDEAAGLEVGEFGAEALVVDAQRAPQIEAGKRALRIGEHGHDAVGKAGDTTLVLSDGGSRPIVTGHAKAGGRAVGFGYQFEFDALGCWRSAMLGLE